MGCIIVNWHRLKCSGLDWTGPLLENILPSWGYLRRRRLDLQMGSNTNGNHMEKKKTLNPVDQYTAVDGISWDRHGEELTVLHERPRGQYFWCILSTILSTKVSPNELQISVCSNLFQLNACSFHLETSNLNYNSLTCILKHLTVHLRDMPHLWKERVWKSSTTRKR